MSNVVIVHNYHYQMINLNINADFKMTKIYKWWGNDEIAKSEYLNKPNQLRGIKHKGDSILSIYSLI